MTYQPNFNDPRVQARCRHAIGFACGVMSKTKSHSWSSRYIDRYFGNSGSQLNTYLRNKLLICTDQYYRFNVPEKQAKCKEYRLNTAGVEYLQAQLKLDQQAIDTAVVQVMKKDHSDELASGNFEYTDKSNRLWHPLQRYRRHHKQQILAEHNYTHQYDIECCAPTLILQSSQMMPDPMDLYLSAIDQYLKDRTQIRQQLAKQIELPENAVKEIINALFAGAVISNNPKSDIYHVLNGDTARIEFLKENEFITELRNNIKTCWTYLRPALQKRTRVTRSGKQRLLPLTSKQKWHFYFNQERQVITSVRDYLDLSENQYFLEHDGWSCVNPVDLNSLRIHVREQTGFDLKFEYNKI
jgi:hypothetical protein